MPIALEIYGKKLPKLPRAVLLEIKNYWSINWRHKFILCFLSLLLVCVGIMYGIAQWYIFDQRNTPYTMGVTFVPDYAASLGIDPNQTLAALIDNMGVRNFRLVSYWSDLEPSPGHYNFNELDQEFNMIADVHGHVQLVVGLRQPRWPECHPPSWINTAAPINQWQPELEKFMSTVVNRYKNNPALQSYELENEYFLKAFGECNNYSRTRLVSEFHLLKSLDPKHPIIVSRSNNAIGTPIGAPTPDEYSISIYKRVWSNTIGRYLEYPFPAWYYAFLAGVEKIINHRNMIIDELQAEPWTPNGKTIPETTLAEQNKSLNPERLEQRFNYARSTGMRTVYFWGAEYWYYRWKIEGDKSVWNVAVQEFKTNR